MKTLIWIMALLVISSSCIALEKKNRLSAEELFVKADIVAIIRLASGDYLSGIGDGYELRGEVLTVLKGEPPEKIAYSDGYDYAEPCFARTLGSYYLVFLENRSTLWAYGASFEVNGGPKFWFGEENDESGISSYIQSKYNQEAFFGNEHAWYLKECDDSKSYNQLMSSILKYAFHESKK